MHSTVDNFGYFSFILKKKGHLKADSFALATKRTVSSQIFSTTVPTLDSSKCLSRAEHNKNRRLSPL
jgi:hypothetical protein